MSDNSYTASPTSDVDLDDIVPVTDAGGPSDSLYDHLAPNISRLGRWDGYGVRVLTNEEESYASVHFRIPAALPATTAAQLAAFSTQRIPYTDRDRQWDTLLGGPTSDRRYVSAFVDSVIDALRFAYDVLEHAVWVHARGEEWTWEYSAPGRNEHKYEVWGDHHPSTYDPTHDPEYT